MCCLLAFPDSTLLATHGSNLARADTEVGEQLKAAATRYLSDTVINGVATRAITKDDFARAYQVRTEWSPFFDSRSRRYIHSPPTLGTHVGAMYCSLGFLVMCALMVQICNRCSKLREKRQDNTSPASNHNSASAKNVVDEVLVRTMPEDFEGKEVKACEHFQWIWCEVRMRSTTLQCCNGWHLSIMLLRMRMYVMDASTKC